MSNLVHPDETQFTGFRFTLALAAVLFVLHAGWIARLQGPYCIDDAYISFRYAQNLASGKGLEFNPGERVEGYTNFGWVLAMTPIELLGWNPAPLSRWLNGLLGLGVIGVALVFLRDHSFNPRLSIPVAAVLLAADGSLARWSQDGLETVLFALLVLVGALGSLRPGRPWFALVLGAATWVRPEGAMCFAILSCTRLLRLPPGRRPGREIVEMAALYATCVVPWLVWKWSYYGTLLPNTFHAKVGYTGAQYLRGLRYVAVLIVAQRWHLAIAAGAAAGLLVAQWKRGALPPWVTSIAALGVGYLAYIVMVGGDWMGPGRFVVPIVAPLYLVFAEIIGAGFRRLPRVGVAALCAVLGGLTFYGTSIAGEQADVREQRPYLESRAAVARWLADHAHPTDTVLTPEIGQLAYLSGLATDDVLGLTDPHIARLEVSTIGQGKAGHEKMDLDYSLGKKPTWIVIREIEKSLDELRSDHPAFAEYELIDLGIEMPLQSYGVVLRRRDSEPR